MHYYADHLFKFHWMLYSLPTFRSNLNIVRSNIPNDIHEVCMVNPFSLVTSTTVKVKLNEVVSSCSAWQGLPPRTCNSLFTNSISAPLWNHATVGQGSPVTRRLMAVDCPGGPERTGPFRQSSVNGVLPGPRVLRIVGGSGKRKKEMSPREARDDCSEFCHCLATNYSRFNPLPTS